MKAITVWQPWSQLLVEGKKHDETRGWATNYRGPILIHAAKRMCAYEILCTLNEDRHFFEEAGITFDRVRNGGIAYGAIIGMANLVDCKLIDETYRDFVKNLCPAEFAFGDFTVGRYAWVMQEPVLFQKPIRIGGRQGLWNYDGPLEEGIHE